MLATILHNFKRADYKTHLVCGFLIRLIVIYYGSYHDENFSVPFTDVDYKVFTDAARHVLNYTSPYERRTYRYTPLVAILLTGNVLLHNCFGKLIFSLVDIVVAVLIRWIVLNALSEFETYKQKRTDCKKETLKLARPDERSRRQRKKHKSAEGGLEISANLSMLFWLYNPLTITIATRGNCDSIAGMLVIMTLYLLQCRHKPFYAGIVHGIAIHVRLYPIAYSLALFMYLSKFSFYSLDSSKLRYQNSNENDREIESPNVINKRQINAKKSNKTKVDNSNKIKTVQLKSPKAKITASQEKKVSKSIFKKDHLYYLIPNLAQIKLIIGCLFSLTFLTGLFYFLYGYAFLYESYIYHFSRRDARHNFSLYFYLQYLTLGIKNIGYWQKVLTTLPQVILLVVFSVRYGLNKLTLNFAILTITIVMVSYNTVLTSQYFVWILAALPLCLWQIRMSKWTTLTLIIVWLTAQVAWLLPAYLLEFHGHNTFMYIWTQSVSLFCANMAILGRLINNFMSPEGKFW